MQRATNGTAPRSSSEAHPAIQTWGLSKHFGTTVAVDDLTLTIPMGSAFALLGPNGAGKSTTLRLLLGLIAPTAGRIALFGDPIPGPGQASRAQLVGSIIEQPAFYPALSAIENLRIMAWSSRIDPAPDELTRRLRRVGLADVAQQKVGTFSSGMQQRLGLAAASLNDPRLLLLDEPTAALDAEGIETFYNFVRRQQAQGVTLVLSSHSLEALETLCTHAAILVSGRCVVQGEMADLLGDHYEVVFEVSDVARGVKILRDVCGVRARAGSTGWIEAKVGKAEIPRLLNALREGSVDVFQSQVRTGGLESFFIQQTRAALTEQEKNT